MFSHNPSQCIIIHACHVGFYVDSSITRNVMGCSPKLPEQEPVTLSTDKSPRILKELWLEGVCALKALGHGSLMIMVPRFLDESMKNSMIYSPKSFGDRKSLVYTQILVTHTAKYALKSCPQKVP